MDWPICHWRQAGGGQPEPEGDNCGSREASSTKLKTGAVANDEFLGFWTVDIHWEGHSQRSAPQKRHKTQLRWERRLPPRTPSGWDWGGDKTHSPPGETELAKPLVT